MNEELYFVTAGGTAVVALEGVPVAMVTHVDSVHDAVPEGQVAVVALVQLLRGGLPAGRRYEVRVRHQPVGRGDVRHGGM